MKLLFFVIASFLGSAAAQYFVYNDMQFIVNVSDSLISGHKDVYVTKFNVTAAAGKGLVDLNWRSLRENWQFLSDKTVANSLTSQVQASVDNLNSVLNVNYDRSYFKAEFDKAYLDARTQFYSDLEAYSSTLRNVPLASYLCYVAVYNRIILAHATFRDTVYIKSVEILSKVDTTFFNAWVQLDTSISSNRTAAVVACIDFTSVCRANYVSIFS